MAKPKPQAANDVVTVPQFKATGIATLKNLNVRKENHRDKKVLAVDLKLQFKSLPQELCDFFDVALLDFFWRADMSVRNIFVEPVSYDVELENCSVHVGGTTYHGATVKRFTLEPLDGGRIKLDCHVILHPGDSAESEVSDLAWLVQEDEHATIEGPPDLFAVAA
jgi:hypothetical protein